MITENDNIAAFILNKILDSQKTTVHFVLYMYQLGNALASPWALYIVIYCHIVIGIGLGMSKMDHHFALSHPQIQHSCDSSNPIPCIQSDD